jgi:hypothetical protein
MIEIPHYPDNVFLVSKESNKDHLASAEERSSRNGKITS